MRVRRPDARRARPTDAHTMAHPRSPISRRYLLQGRIGLRQIPHPRSASRAVPTRHNGSPTRTVRGGPHLKSRPQRVSPATLASRRTRGKARPSEDNGGRLRRAPGTVRQFEHSSKVVEDNIRLLTSRGRSAGDPPLIFAGPRERTRSSLCARARSCAHALTPPGALTALMLPCASRARTARRTPAS